MNKELFTAVYMEPRTFLKYDENHVIIYPDETIIPDYTPETQEGQEIEPYTGYQYIGTEKDGGFVVECNDCTDYHDLANAIIRSHYSLSEEMALQRHYQNDPEQYAAKWEAYCEYADGAAAKARLWLGIA